jgi:hypothetical protein
MFRCETFGAFALAGFKGGSRRCLENSAAVDPGPMDHPNPSRGDNFPSSTTTPAQVRESRRSAGTPPPTPRRPSISYRLVRGLYSCSLALVVCGLLAVDRYDQFVFREIVRGFYLFSSHQIYIVTKEIFFGSYDAYLYIVKRDAWMRPW